MKNSTAGLRITKACDACHKRSRRCRTADGDDKLPCQSCLSAGLVCTRDRVSAKRGPKPGRRRTSFATPSESIAEQRRVAEPFLVFSFFQNVYPIVNYVHERAFMDVWQTGSVPSTKLLYARLMAMCSLSGYRLKNGTNSATGDVLTAANPEYYLNEAILAVRNDSETPKEVEYLQTIGLICVTALEISNAFLIQRYMGIYHAVVAEQGLYDEQRWPAGITSTEREERRRLYWHMYRLEVHMAMIMGHAIRCPELQSIVSYPESEDVNSSKGSESEWLSGWNFVTDLYRGLEHLLTKVRLRVLPTRRQSIFAPTFLTKYDHEKHILAPLNTAFDNLPERFKTANPLSSNSNSNRAGFQTANIICTYLLLKMVAYSISRADFRRACATALELIERITSIPLDYVKIMSLAMIQELSGFGYILSTFIGKSLSQSDYGDLKNVMLCMAEFLESLQSTMPYATKAGAELRGYVEKIDGMLSASTASASTDLRPSSSHTIPAKEQAAGAEHQVHLTDEDVEMLLRYANGIPWVEDWNFEL